MKKNLVLAGFVIIAISLTSCSKKIDAIIAPSKGSETVPATGQFVKYSIASGEQYADKNYYVPVSYNELKFVAKFDSSAVYKTLQSGNQTDINKLYGFSDNNGPHHDYSARFGWRWSNNALRLFSYVYNKGVMTCKELGTVAIGAEVNCSIKVQGDLYVFTLNGETSTMLRASTTASGLGYKLYPYFGGDELAPHPINIWIKEF